MQREKLERKHTTKALHNNSIQRISHEKNPCKENDNDDDDVSYTSFNCKTPEIVLKI